MSTTKILVKDAYIHYYFTVIVQLEIRLTIQCDDAFTQQGRYTQPDIEEIPAEFKSRVDPEKFVHYLKRLTEEDEVFILILFTISYFIQHSKRPFLKIKFTIKPLRICIYVYIYIFKMTIHPSLKQLKS